MNQPPPDDPARDAHLLAALRHAPDHDVAPPAQVTATILGQAQQALRPPLADRPAWREGLRAAFARLWQPAPMAAFGTLAMATLIGVMWSGQEWPDATPSLRPEIAAAPQVETQTAASATMAAAPPPVAQDEPAREAARAEPRAPARKPPPKPATFARPAAPAAPSESSTAAARQDAAQERRSLSDAAAPAAPHAAPPTPTAPAPAGVAASPAPRDTLAKASADAQRAPARARSEVAAPALGATALAMATPLAAAGAEIAAATRADAAPVRWQVTPQRVVAHGAAQRDWWSALARTTHGRWQLVAPDAAGSGPPLTLLIDGAPRGSLSFEAQAVVWRDASGVTWRTAVGPEQVRAWQEAISRW